MQNKKIYKILISPLDWGLGHASRCIPLIQLLLDNNFEVIVASSESPKKIIQDEFPNIEYIEFPCVTIRYSEKIPAFLKISMQIPKFLYGILLERIYIRKIIKEKNINLIISDNRYGFFSKKIPSIFITHQLAIKLPKILSFFEKSLYYLHKKIISKFDKIFIPDNAGEDNASGDLSHRFPKPENAVFIGILSRFKQTRQENHKYDILAIISGPEPSRTIFEKKITARISKTQLKAVISGGIPQKNICYEKDNIKYFSHLKTSEMQEVLNASKTIICRSGYSSVMDILRMKKKAIIFPTKGQTEQEYLARYLNNKHGFISQNIENSNIPGGISELETRTPDYKNFILEEDIILKTIIDLLNKK